MIAKGIIETPQDGVELEEEEKRKHIGHCCLDMIYFMSCGTMKCKCKKKKHDEDDCRHLHDYTSGESETEFETQFNDLETEEKTTRILFLWKKAFNRSRGGVLIINKLQF
jgi:hypothetical protein